MPWNNFGPSVQLRSVNIPAVRCFTTGYLVSKASFQGCDIGIQYESSPGTPNLSASVSGSGASGSARRRLAGSGNIQMRLGDDWTASIHPSEECFRRIRRYFSFSNTPVRDALNGLFNCFGLKRKLRIAEGVDLNISVSPDTDLCFFGIQVNVEYDTSPFRVNIGGRDYNIRLAVQADLTIRFGLSPSGWQQLIRWCGTRATSLVSRVPGLVARVVACLTVTTAIIVIGTVVCTALLVAGMAYLISDARQRGINRVNALNYATGYVDALMRPELSRSGYQDAIDRYRGHDARINGYVDAVHNGIIFGYRRTRLRMLTVIGMDGVLDAEGPGGRRFTYSFGGNRFPYSTRNNIIGALQHFIETGHVRAITVPLWIE